jgi:hypothetical protein
MKLTEAFPLMLLGAGACLMTVAAIHAYPAGPPAGVTGGFGEDTCVKCHNSFDLNAGRAMGLGDLAVSGLPKQYQPGQTYQVKVEHTHVKDRSVWGFQLAARAKESGQQAGELKPVDDHTQVLSEKGIQYVEHTAEGTFSNVFQFDWTAPRDAVGDIVFNAAGNAADGDASAVGDYIYSTSIMIPAASH